MGFTVHLKEGPIDPVTVDADFFVIEAGMYLFSKESIDGYVASFPGTNVLSVVKENVLPVE